MFGGCHSWFSPHQHYALPQARPQKVRSLLESFLFQGGDGACPGPTQTEHQGAGTYAFPQASQTHLRLPDHSKGTGCQCLNYSRVLPAMNANLGFKVKMSTSTCLFFLLKIYSLELKKILMNSNCVFSVRYFYTWVPGALIIK